MKPLFFASFFHLICTLFFLTTTSFAAQAQSKKAMVINQGALVYTQPDFDAPVLTELKAGRIYDISLKTKGPFYKIRIKPTVTGWIADTDVKTGKFKPMAKGKAKARPGAKPAGKPDGKLDSESAMQARMDVLSEKRKRRPFSSARYRGPVIAYLAYAENTMGSVRTDSSLFYGVKLEGPNVLMSGDTRTDVEFLFHPGAPKFYESTTGQSATGWVFLTDFVFETAFPQSPWHMVTIGFGPMFKYTHYEVGLVDAGHPAAYSLDDMTVGAVFDGGLAFHLRSYALRFNAKYFWEKTKYFGGSVTFGFPF